MFESVAPEAFRKRHRGLSYQVLPFSIGVHALAVAGALLGTIWTVKFPVESPRLVRAYSLVEIPPPPPPPPPPPASPAPKPQVEPAPPPQPIDEIVAPTVIPNTIPIVPNLTPRLEPAPPAVADTAPSDTDGAQDGEPGGVAGGIAGGIPGSIPFPDDGRVHVERGQSLPLKTVSQEFPRYPPDAIKQGLEDQVVLRYVIGKNGRVIDVQILSHASLPSFDTAAVEAIRKWRFRPMIKDGQPVEVEHDLAINFVLMRH